MNRYKKYFIFIFILLVLYNIFLLPVFFKKITRCYITLEINIKLNSEIEFNKIESKKDKIISSFSNVSSLYSKLVKSSEQLIMVNTIRIIDSKLEDCEKTYRELDKVLIKELPTTDLFIKENTKSKARAIYFFIINNIILLLVLTGVYFIFSEKISLTLTIKR